MSIPSFPPRPEPADGTTFWALLAARTQPTPDAVVLIDDHDRVLTYRADPNHMSACLGVTPDVIHQSFPIPTRIANQPPQNTPVT